MTHESDETDMRNRARRAYERTISNQPPTEPVDPATLAKLQRAVASLRKRDRAVFLAHRLEGLSYAQIATSTGLTEDDICRHMARALGEIVRFMDDRPVRRWRIWPF